jgi:hypothetical protein
MGQFDFGEFVGVSGFPQAYGHFTGRQDSLCGQAVRIIGQN